MYERFGKRSIDCFLVLLSLPIVIPLLFFLLLLMKLSDPKGAVFFRQLRIGKDGKPFWIYKLRTMRAEFPRYKPQSEMTRAEYRRYVTPMGRFLRITGLDELPQLYNILKGDMSLVGPRPVIPHETELIDGRAKAHVDTLRPGIAGLAQYKGRSELSDEQKLLFYTYYLEHISLLFDCKCLLCTVGVIIAKRGFGGLY